MPILITQLSWSAAAAAARRALVNHFGLVPPEDGVFENSLHNVIDNWAAITLDTAANPGNGVNGSGPVIYTAAGPPPIGRNYLCKWSVNVHNWVIHNNCSVTITNVWS